MRKLLLVLLVLMLAPSTWAIEKIDPDPKGVELCQKFLEACLIEDPQARLAAVLPLLHKSMLTTNGKDLDRNVKEFSYAKACGGAKFYAIPVVIGEVHQGRVTQVGFRETTESGRTDKYFVTKKAGVPGLPAPLHVFWPSDGGAPKLINIGSL